MHLAILLASCSEPPPDSGPVIDTVAGIGGVLMAGADGLPARETGLYMPTAVTFAPDTGRLVLDDFNNFRIRELGEDGKLRTIVGIGAHAWAVPGPAAESPLENPIDLTWAPDGSLVIAELHTGRLLRVRDGVLSILAGGAGDQVGHAGDGGPAVAGLLSEARGVTASDDGTVYVADTENHCIRAVTPDGALEHVAGGDAGYVDGDLADARFYLPERIRWLDGSLWLADTQNHAIRRIDLAAGTVETVAGTGEPGFDGDGGPGVDALLDQPASMLPEPDGGLWIADSQNHRVRYVDPDGTIRTVVGDGQPTFAGDGGAPGAASLQFPADLARESAGDLYVADLMNGAIRRVQGVDELLGGAP